MTFFSPEDRVRFLHQTGEGIVIRQDGDECLIEDENGFEYTVPASQLVKVNIDAFTELQSINSSLNSLARAKSSKTVKAKNQKTGGKGIQVLEVDLHQQTLCPESHQLSPVEIHELQKRTILETLEREKKHHGRQIIFVHGKGDGTLRRELIEILKRNSLICSFEDAPFNKYGINGAIKVTIKTR